MALPPGVFSFRGPWHTFVLARGGTYRELLQAGKHVELRAIDKIEATETLAKIAENSGWQLRAFYQSVGISPPSGAARRSPRALADALLAMADRGHFGILRELTGADHGADRHGPPEGPVKQVLDVLKRERNGEIAYKGLI